MRARRLVRVGPEVPSENDVAVTSQGGRPTTLVMRAAVTVTTILLQERKILRAADAIFTKSTFGRCDYCTNPLAGLA